MFNLGKGSIASNFNGVCEGYKIDSNIGFSTIQLNIDINKLDDLIACFINSLQEPCFFILEVPTNIKDEPDKDKLHNDVFYLDNCKRQFLLELWEKNKDLLLNDGLVHFGFAEHNNTNELFVTTYKITYIYSYKPDEYVELLHKFQIKQYDDLKTVRDNFTKETPGKSMTVKVNNKSIYDLVDELKHNNMYLAKRVEL